MSKEMSPYAAIIGFASWLTTRDESVIAGASHESGTMATLAITYMKERGIITQEKVDYSYISDAIIKFVKSSSNRDRDDLIANRLLELFSDSLEEDQPMLVEALDACIAAFLRHPRLLEKPHYITLTPEGFIRVTWETPTENISTHIEFPSRSAVTRWGILRNEWRVVHYLARYTTNQERYTLRNIIELQNQCRQQSQALMVHL